MRIVGGQLGGRTFRGPPGDRTRPTSERVREALASALAARGRIDGARVLELYAGTGALSFEALSRGARDAVLVESDRAVAAALDVSARSLGLEARTTSLRLDLHAPRAVERLPPGPYDLVFCDPPYVEAARAMAVVRAVHARGLLADDACVVFEHARSTPPPDAPEFAPLARYEYGDTVVVLLVATLSVREPSP